MQVKIRDGNPKRPRHSVTRILKTTKSFKIGLLLLTIHAVSAAFGSAETTFETFKGLEGRWAIQSEGKTLSIEMTYAAGSKGSIVMEQFGKELSVIYRDGESHDDPFLQRR